MAEDDLIQIADAKTSYIIKVIGVGGGGGNAVAQMYRDGISNVSYLVANTDRKALEDNPVPEHLQIGPGLGAGGSPEKGRELAETEVDKIAKVFDSDTQMVFITAGMGGGTGTGASPIFAREARKRGILTIGIVTIPFLFEREVRIDKALDGLEMLQKEVDAMLVINNQRLCDIYSDLSVVNAFKRADETLSTAVRSITEIIYMHGRITLDFEDVCTTLRNGGVAVMSSGYAEGDNRVTNAINQALNSPLLNNNDVFKATHILLSITMNDDPKYVLRTEELNEVTAFMEAFNPDVQTKWGLTVDKSLDKQIKITIVASGFGIYGPKSSTDGKIAEEEQIDPQVENRRKVFYTDYRYRQGFRRKPLFYLFSEDDLCNEDVLQMVEDTPTLKRTNDMLEQLKRLSEN